MVALAQAVGVASLCVGLLLIGWLVALRWSRRWRASRLARIEPHWRDALRAAIEEDAKAARLDHVRALDLPYFVTLWNRAVERQSGDAVERLGMLLTLHGLDKRVLRMLRRFNPRARVLAINALGYLREPAAWPRLQKLTHHRDPVISFAAAMALIRIDSRGALDHLAGSIPERTDWPIARLATVYQSLGAPVVTASLVAMLLRRPQPGVERALKLARFGHRERIATIVLGWLGSSADPELITAALDYVDHKAELPWAQQSVGHEDWRVRLAATKALARVGGREEMPRLLELLKDPVWWVRYHAAQALTRMEGLEAHELETLRSEARDAFAADMLSQALAERRWT